MRTAILSAACSLLLLFCSDSAFAQSSPTREAPQPQVTVGHEPLVAGVFERQKAEPSGIQIHGEATNHPANPDARRSDLARTAPKK